MVASTRDPAFVVDLGGRITAWNAAAEHLFGLTAEMAVGRVCSETIRARDVFGNPYCCRSCPVHEAASRGEPVGRFRLTVNDATLHRIAADFSILVVGDGDREVGIVHILHPVCEDAPGPQLPGNATLTPRELEVLELLGRGVATRGIADELFISPLTVRSHVQSLLRKLGVHSRLEAVATARRAGLT